MTPAKTGKISRRICPIAPILGIAYLWFCLWSASVFLGCAAYPHKLRKLVAQDPVFQQAFTGFTLMDAERGKILFDFHGDQHFIPASTNKLLTLYACLNTWKDSLPAFKYVSSNQFLFIQPTGDPTFLHPKFQAWQSGFNFIQSHPAYQKGFILPLQSDELGGLGPGWAWDDAGEAYSAERSTFPVYGNLKRIYSIHPHRLTVAPAYWRAYLRADTSVQAKQNIIHFGDNHLAYNPLDSFPSDFEAWFPVHKSTQYLIDLLADTLHQPFDRYQEMPNLASKLWYSAPTDTVYRRMMYESDNFVAEQLLLMCSLEKTGTILPDRFMAWAKDSLFCFFPQKIRWVDGSGLSRYNLNTPQNNVALLYHLWKQIPQTRLFNLFPAGGKSGTLKAWYQIETGEAYIWAKSGSMSGVQCLSGFIFTRKGKVLIFSFMINNFVGSGKPWKLKMQHVLEQIRLI